MIRYAILNGEALGVCSAPRFPVPGYEFVVIDVLAARPSFRPGVQRALIGSTIAAPNELRPATAADFAAFNLRPPPDWREA